jgi:hypothetical protein
VIATAQPDHERARRAFRQRLIDGDFAAARSIARTMGLPYKLPSDAWLDAWGHGIRTMLFIPPRQRYYSHCWLVERNLPSHLPDHMKRSAERMYPKKVKAVMIAAKGNAGPEACGSIVRAMSVKVDEMYADGDDDAEIVTPQMQRARMIERRGLMLPIPQDIPMAWRP